MGLLLLVASSYFSLYRGNYAEKRDEVSREGSLDSKALYFAARCFLHQCDPYQESEFRAYYLANDTHPPSDPLYLEVITHFVNLPTTLLICTPFALLPWSFAHVFWKGLIFGGLTTAAALIWYSSLKFSPWIATFLACLLLANYQWLIHYGNAAGIVVGACVIAVWCFLHNRCITLGVLCLAVSLIVKPHDAGLVWLYLLLAGGACRKRALQTVAVAVVLGLAAFVWVSVAVPHWGIELRNNLAAMSAPEGLNDPGPGGVTSDTIMMIISLQSAIQMAWNDPKIYIPCSYVICGTLLLIWATVTLCSRVFPNKAWFALATVVPLTMLVTYHRVYDAKLLLLAVPACALLWAEGGVIAILALVLTSAAIALTADIPLRIYLSYTTTPSAETAGIFGKLLAIAEMRAPSVGLLALAIFNLWAYVLRATKSDEEEEARNLEPNTAGEAELIAGT